MYMKNKKNLISVSLIAIIALISLTFAFFSDYIEIPNTFKTKPYKTSVIEQFVSPDNWTPGTTTTKKVYAVNEGDVDAAVRISYSEEWVSATGDILSNTINNERVVSINFANTSDWTKVGDYYYYNKKLTKDSRSSSFIESVTFNSNVPSDSSCDDENLVDEDTGQKTGIKKTCSSSGNGYDGATYTLTINVETIQYNLYQEIWNTDVTIN